MTGLALPEEMYLLAQRMRGERTEDAVLRVAVCGAALQDLLLSGHLRVRRSPARTVVAEGESSALACAALKRVHRRILAAGEDQDLQGWMAELLTQENLAPHACARLEAAGVIERDAAHGAARLVDTGPWMALRRRVRDAILQSDVELDTRTRALVTIAARSGVLAGAFDARVLAAYEQHVYRLSRQIRLGPATAASRACEEQESAAGIAVLLYVLAGN